MGNPFLTFFCDNPSAPKKYLEFKYGHSHFKSAFGINFGLWEELKIRHLHQLAQLAYFQLDDFPKSKLIPTADLKCEYPYYYSKKFYRSVLIITIFSQKLISYCILKSCLANGRGEF